MTPRSHPHLYAVVSHDAAPPETIRRRHNIAELRERKLAEINAKKAIDRANEILDRLDKRIAAYDAQIDELARRKRYAVERAERIGDQVLAKMEADALTRVEGFHRSFLSVPSPAAVEIAGDVPAEYLRQPKTPVPAPDRVAIAKALKAGKSIPNCYLVQGFSLRRT